MLATGSRSVALTFDDGPDPVNTPKMLDLLKKNRVKATFCLVGTQVRANPALVRRIVKEGHTLCNHSWRHRLDLAKQPDDVVLKDLQATNDAIRAAVPDAKIKYFRAPGGNFDRHLVNLAASLGMKSLYWAVDPRDWDASHYGKGTAMVNHIISVIKTHARPGAVILSHDFKKPDTITAYKTLLPWLKAHYKLIALPT
jgi:peptidoglycan/xylan/chitin deacetylase (PgdA/CDA1 family)